MVTLHSRRHGHLDPHALFEAPSKSIFDLPRSRDQRCITLKTPRLQLDAIDSRLDALLQRREALTIVLLQQLIGVLVRNDAKVTPSRAIVGRESLARTQLAEQSQNIATIERSGEREDALSGARWVTERDGVKAGSISDVDIVLRREKVESVCFAVEKLEQPSGGAGTIGSVGLEYWAKHGIGQYGGNLEWSLELFRDAPDGALGFSLRRAVHL